MQAIEQARPPAHANHQDRVQPAPPPFGPQPPQLPPVATRVGRQAKAWRHVGLRSSAPCAEVRWPHSAIRTK
eukprot:scaffold284300_cov30-Tisochrysis_lutea.AAC.7